MQVIVVLIGFSLLVAVGFLLAFLWAVRNGQYDDDVSPGMRMLYDEKKPEIAILDPTSNENEPV
jgi:cbb3-type cytochrome oxidase maturation protein